MFCGFEYEYLPTDNQVYILTCSLSINLLTWRKLICYVSSTTLNSEVKL